MGILDLIYEWNRGTWLARPLIQRDVDQAQGNEAYLLELFIRDIPCTEMLEFMIPGGPQLRARHLARVYPRHKMLFEDMAKFLEHYPSSFTLLLK